MIDLADFELPLYNGDLEAKHGLPENVARLKEVFAGHQALALDFNVIEKLVYDSVIIKSSIVNQDAREKGIRRKLNFGHTFGHAIEKTLQVRHGEAVGTGMVLASALSVKRGRLKHRDADRISRLLEKYRLPVQLPYDKNQVLEALRMDKKREGECIKFVLLPEIGRAFVDDVSIQELEALINP